MCYIENIYTRPKPVLYIDGKRKKYSSCVFENEYQSNIISIVLDDGEPRYFRKFEITYTIRKTLQLRVSDEIT